MRRRRRRRRRRRACFTFRFWCYYTLGLEKKLFVSCNGMKKYRVGRSVKNIFLDYFLGQKCMFYACFTLIGSWEGGKNLRVGISLNKNLLEYRVTGNKQLFLGHTFSS